jgi:hypothetical protein
VVLAGLAGLDTLMARLRAQGTLCRRRHSVHLIRDYQDTAECYTEAIWPVQASGPACAQSNPAEDIRPTHQQGGRPDRSDIRSYIDNIRKHGCNVMDVLRTAMTGARRRPPIPAPA